MSPRDELYGPHSRKRLRKPTPIWVWAALTLVGVVLLAFVVLPSIDPASRPGEGDRFEDFELEVIGDEPGSRLRLSDLRGQPVVLDFWASWCPPCREQSAVLSAVTPELKGKAHIVGVATGDEKVAAAAFVKDHRLSYVNVFDTKGEVGQAAGASSLPTLVILDSDGIVRSVVNQVLSRQELLSLLNEAAE